MSKNRPGLVISGTSLSQWRLVYSFPPQYFWIRYLCNPFISLTNVFSHAGVKLVPACVCSLVALGVLVTMCAVCMVLVGVGSGVLMWNVMLDTQELYKHQLHGKVWLVENSREYKTSLIGLRSIYTCDQFNSCNDCGFPHGLNSISRIAKFCTETILELFLLFNTNISIRVKLIAGVNRRLFILIEQMRNPVYFTGARCNRTHCKRTCVFFHAK